MPDAILLLESKQVDPDGAMIEIVVWQLDEPLPPCTHRYKYRLYHGATGVCRVRYDNERGKGDHRHYGGKESPYAFSTIQALLDDFRRDIDEWKRS